MASTDLPAASGVAPFGADKYLVPDWVRVRAESFGLLFYDARSTKLTFVRSGDSLVPPPFTGSRRVLGVGAPREGAWPALSRLLEKLVARGLIVDAATDT